MWATPGERKGPARGTKPPPNHSLLQADRSGVGDATLALQSAIDFARHNYLSLWLPVGEYRVTRRPAQPPDCAPERLRTRDFTACVCVCAILIESRQAP